jgi:hypothetical protein
MQKLRIHAVPLADDDGKRKYTFTLDNLAKGVVRANKALAFADVGLVFDPTWDWQPRNDTKLNNENNSGASWWAYGNQIAARYPGKIVIFFRHGPGADPVGWGHAYPPNTGQTVPPVVPLPTDDVTYVALPNARDWDTPDNGNFIAHEVGHYLGLFHTHPGWGTGDLYPGSADTAAKAEQALVDSPRHGGARRLSGDSPIGHQPRLLPQHLLPPGSLPHQLRPLLDHDQGQERGEGRVVHSHPAPRQPHELLLLGCAAEADCAAEGDGPEDPHERPPPHPHRAAVRARLPPRPDRPLPALLRLLAQPGPRAPHPELHRSPHLRLVPVRAPHAGLDDAHLGQLPEAFREYFAQKMRPARDGGGTGPEPAITGIWQTIEAAFHASHRMTIADFDTEWHAKRKAGWLHTDLYIYRDGGRLLASSTWVRRSGTTTPPPTGMTADEYVQRREDFGKKRSGRHLLLRLHGRWQVAVLRHLGEGPRLVAALVQHVSRGLPAEVPRACRQGVPPQSDPGLREPLISDLQEVVEQRGSPLSSKVDVV